MTDDYGSGDVGDGGDAPADGTWSDESEFTGWEDADDDGADGVDEGPAPTLAVVGRPNVGKSTLVNRLIGRREAVVQDVPGVTRDRVTHDALWRGRRFTVVDTGGWDPTASGLQAAVTAQAERAMQISDAVLVVVDASVGATETALMAAGVLTWLSVPIALVIGTIGAVSVIKAVYVDKRELKCACVGGDSNVPLGFLSLTENVMMVAMALWMVAAPAVLSMPY